MAAKDLGMDMITKRPRTPRDPYTTLTETQMKNLKKNSQAFYMYSRPDKPYPEKGWYRDRYATNMSEHLVRGISKSQPHCYIDYQWTRYPPDLHNTCRLGSSERWGPDKVGARTIQHFNNPEDTNRFVNTELYRRQPTNQPGPIQMAYGRPDEGYYTMKNPHTATWFGSTAPLNKTRILQSIHPKSTAEYEALREQQHQQILARKGKFPQYSEYTDRFGLQTKLEPIMNTRQLRKMYLQEA